MVLLIIYAMSELFKFNSTLKSDPDVNRWLKNHNDELGSIACLWFQFMRSCGGDVQEKLHDGQPTACVGNVAFAYVDAFKSHINVGFFRGADLPDPSQLLQGRGKYMRHVKIAQSSPADSNAVKELIKSAYFDIKKRIEEEKI